MLETLRQEIETLPIDDQKCLLAIVHDLRKDPKPVQYYTQIAKAITRQIPGISITPSSQGDDTKDTHAKQMRVLNKRSNSQITDTELELIEALPDEVWLSLSDLKAVANLEQWQEFQKELLRLVLDHRYQLIQAKIAEKIDKNWLDSLETEDEILESLHEEIETLPIATQEKVSRFVLTLKKEQQPIQYRTQAFKELLQQIKPASSDFDPDKAKWEYLKEKYNL